MGAKANENGDGDPGEAGRTRGYMDWPSQRFKQHEACRAVDATNVRVLGRWPMAA